MMKKQAEIEAVMIGDMEGQVGEGVEQSLESELNKEIFYAKVKEEMFFNEEIQQNIIEPVDKPFKENIPQDVGELSSEEKEGKWKGNKQKKRRMRKKKNVILRYILD